MRSREDDWVGWLFQGDLYDKFVYINTEKGDSKIRWRAALRGWGRALVEYFVFGDQEIPMVHILQRYCFGLSIYGILGAASHEDMF